MKLTARQVAHEGSFRERNIASEDRSRKRRKIEHVRERLGGRSGAKRLLNPADICRSRSRRRHHHHHLLTYQLITASLFADPAPIRTYLRWKYTGNILG
jgi:hypothetical protein